MLFDFLQYQQKDQKWENACPNVDVLKTVTTSPVWDVKCTSPAVMVVCMTIDRVQLP